LPEKSSVAGRGMPDSGGEMMKGSSSAKGKEGMVSGAGEGGTVVGRQGQGGGYQEL
jgi:hypothetical protein